MPSSSYLRNQADLCHRLALLSSDESDTKRLLAMAERYRAQAEGAEASPVNAIAIGQSRGRSNRSSEIDPE